MRTGTRLVLALAMATGCGWRAMGQTQDAQAQRVMRQQATAVASAATQPADGSRDRIQTLEARLERLMFENLSLRERLREAGLEDASKDARNQPWIDIRYPGGSMKDLVDRIKELQPRANILLEPDAAGWKIPQFEAFGVTPAAALEIAQNIIENPRELEVHRVRAADESATATVIRVARWVKDQARSGEDRATHHPATLPANAPAKAWNLKNWLDSNTGAINGALAAIQVGMETYSVKPVIKYHEPTGVLMVRAMPDQIAFIESILEAALQSPSNLQTADHLEQEIRATESRITRLQGAQQVRIAELNAATAAVKVARENQELDHMIAQRQVAVVKAEVAIAEGSAELLRAMKHHEELKRQLEELRRQSPGS